MAKRKKQLTVSETLRKAIEDAYGNGITSYRIAKDAGIAISQIDRFSIGERTLRLETVDKICEVLGLELRPKE